MVHTRGQQAGALSPANPGSSAAAGDSVAFQATNVASSGFKNDLSGTPASGSPASGTSAGGHTPQQGVLEKSTCIGTQIGMSTYSDDPLHIRTDTDESGDKHHTRYGVGTGIRGVNGVFGASGEMSMSSSSSRSSYRNPRPGPSKMPKIQLKIKRCQQPIAGNKTAKASTSPRKAGRH